MTDVSTARQLSATKHALLAQCLRDRGTVATILTADRPIPAGWRPEGFADREAMSTRRGEAP
jgi:hypothetical protein